VDAPNTTDPEVSSQRVAEAEERCVRQRALIERMAAGQDTADAESVLRRFESTLDLLRQHQQRLLRGRENRS
jgi:hypothetical protein